MADEKTSSALSVGSKAPGFSLPSRSGQTVSLGDYAGKNEVLVYFYPKDDTPGCTKQACSLRDAWKDLTDAGIVVLGISRDSAEAHEAFTAKYSLPFELLTDADHAVHAAYGAWGVIGPQRHAFLVDKEGNVRIIFKGIDTSRFAADVLLAAGFKVAEPAPTVYDDAKAAVAEAKEKVQEAFNDAKAAVNEAVPAVKKAARKAVADFEKKPAVKKAVQEVKKAAKKASASAKKAIAEAKRKPAVKKAVKAVKSAVANLQKRAGKAAPPPAKKVAKKAAPPAKKAVKSAAPAKVVKKVAKKAAPPAKKAAGGKKR